MIKNKFKIPLNEPNLIGNEWKYIKKCLDTNWVSTAGKFVKLFEKKYVNLQNQNTLFVVSMVLQPYIFP